MSGGRIGIDPDRVASAGLRSLETLGSALPVPVHNRRGNLRVRPPRLRLQHVQGHQVPVGHSPVVRHGDGKKPAQFFTVVNTGTLVIASATFAVAASNSGAFSVACSNQWDALADSCSGTGPNAGGTVTGGTVGTGAVPCGTSV
jgi:hypothetical protein